MEKNEAPYFYQIFKSPIGPLHLVAKEHTLVALAMKKNWPQIEKKIQKTMTVVDKKSNSVLKLTAIQLEEYFARSRTEFDLPLEPEGTDFQRMVWSSLISIPYGKTISYKAQSEILKKPLAIRAIARANGQNPISIIHPCHRVIGSSGDLTGYAGGLSVKKFLLELEQRG